MQWLLLIIISICARVASSQENFTFAYTLSDLLIIPYLTTVDTSSSLATSSYLQIEDGDLQLNQSFTQVVNASQPFIPYNIIYFNLSNSIGSNCYYNYFSNSTPIPQNRTIPCNQVNQYLQSKSIWVSCMNFTDCLNENFTYSIELDEISYKQSIVMIENNHNANQGKQYLYLNMSNTVRVYNSNGWFYWSVALTCLLLLSLVLLTGVVLYWSLKLTKAQRALEELRLTEVDEEVSSLRKSFRKSVMKEQ